MLALFISKDASISFGIFSRQDSKGITIVPECVPGLYSFLYIYLKCPEGR